MLWGIPSQCRFFFISSDLGQQVPHHDVYYSAAASMITTSKISISSSVHICVVCWGKLPTSADMAAHRTNCKIQTNGASLPPTTNSKKLVAMEDNAVTSDEEITKLVSTPDIQCYEDLDDSNPASKNSSPPPQQPQAAASKRGRKKQLHPQQVLTPERIKEVAANNLVQCGLCEIVIPSIDQAKHLVVNFTYIHTHHAEGLVNPKVRALKKGYRVQIPQSM
jgi:hypothetical protein